MSLLPVVFFALALALLLRVLVPERELRSIGTAVFVAYFLRLFLLLTVMRTISFFSHGQAGGDCMQYEAYAELVGKIWDGSGIHFVRGAEIEGIEQVALICNAFALVNLVSGGSTVLGCTAFVAFTACATGLVVYAFAREIGAQPKGALYGALFTLFGPAFLYFSSDMYKDALNAFLVVSSIFLARRLAQRFTVGPAILLPLLLTALWFVRPYMVAMCLIPIGVALLGGGRISFRTIVVLLGLIVAGLVMVQIRASNDAVASTQSALEAQFTHGVDQNARNYNAEGGSGVTFDDGGNPFGALIPKLLYTIFSPFPWMGGSIGLQLGKLDTFGWYAAIYFGWRAARRIWNEDRATATTLLLFLAPGFFIYSLSMANVGLIVRQRLPLVFIVVVLAATEIGRRRPKPVANTQPALNARLPRISS
jgi:hypothetical protein